MNKNNSGQKGFFNSLGGERSEKADCLHRLLKSRGINFATGVPCGVLKNVISNLLNDSEVFHVPANRESEVVGIAAGAYLSGKNPIVYMQNSGLFSASNDIASLLIPYKIPIFFVVSYRGCEGEDAIQHLTTGRATERLLNSFNLPYEVYNQQNLGTLINRMFVHMERKKTPMTLLLKRGWEQ